MLTTRRILRDRDLDELDANSLSFVRLINLQVEPFTELQTVDVASGLDKAIVLRSVARPPALIQLKSENETTWVERVLADFREIRVFEIYVLQSFARCALDCIAGGLSGVAPPVRRFKPDKGFPIWQAISYVAVVPLSANSDVICDRDFNCERNAICQDIGWDQRDFKKGGFLDWACVECDQVSGCGVITVNVGCVTFKPRWRHSLMVNELTLQHKDASCQ